MIGVLAIVVVGRIVIAQPSRVTKAIPRSLYIGPEHDYHNILFNFDHSCPGVWREFMVFAYNL